jgi:hypothetical protein
MQHQVTGCAPSVAAVDDTVKRPALLLQRACSVQDGLTVLYKLFSTSVEDGYTICEGQSTGTDLSLRKGKHGTVVWSELGVCLVCGQAEASSWTEAMISGRFSTLCMERDVLKSQKEMFVSELESMEAQVRWLAHGKGGSVRTPKKCWTRGWMMVLMMKTGRTV